MMDLGQNCWYAYRSCRLWRWVRCPGSTTCCATTTGPSVDMPSDIEAMSRRYEFWENPRRPPKRCWQDVRKGHLTVVRPWSWKGSDLMCVTQSYSISLSVGFLDKSPRSIGLCGSSWYPWCCGSNVWTYADAHPPPPPGFFESPVFRASTV